MVTHRRKESYENKILTGKKEGTDGAAICYAFDDHFYGVRICSIDHIVCFQSSQIRYDVQSY